MPDKISERFKNAWNVFFGKSNSTDSFEVIRPNEYVNYGVSSFSRPDRHLFSNGSEKTIINSVYNRIAVDVAATSIKHARVDDDGRYLYDIKSGLNNCLTLDTNIDQTSRSFFVDVVISLLDEGCIAIVPIDTTKKPELTDGYDILTMRVGKIVQWYPRHVKVNVYNERTGKKEDIVLAKSDVAIIENPLYSVMNEPNSTLKRLIRKLSLLDFTDDRVNSGKLDLIIQLPYTIKTAARQQQAENRRKEIESQLVNSKYGIAYTDGTEKVTQLNRSLDNNLMKQIEYLTSMLYSQLGMTTSVLDGTADEKTMLNYYNRTIEPILAAIVDEMRRKFLSKTARSQGQTIVYYRDPFKLVEINKIADIADKFTRNEIMTANEIRQIIGIKPSNDPNADVLLNKNLNHPEGSIDMDNTEFEDINSDIDPNLEEQKDVDVPYQEDSNIEINKQLTNTVKPVDSGKEFVKYMGSIKISDLG